MRFLVFIVADMVIFGTRCYVAMGGVEDRFKQIIMNRNGRSIGCGGLEPKLA